MESRAKQKLKESQHSFELYTDNVRILQRNLQQLMTDQVQLNTTLQAELSKLKMPLEKEKQNFQSASREFERAQSIFNRQQQTLKKAEEAYEQKASQLERSTASALLALQNSAKQIEKELVVTDIKSKNAERDVKAYSLQVEKEEKQRTEQEQHKEGRKNMLR